MLLVIVAALMVVVLLGLGYLDFDSKDAQLEVLRRDRLQLRRDRLEAMKAQDHLMVHDIDGQIEALDDEYYKVKYGWE